MFELGYITNVKCIINITKHKHLEIKHFLPITDKAVTGNI